MKKFLLLLAAASLVFSPVQAAVDQTPSLGHYLACGSNASVDNIWTGGGAVSLWVNRDRTATFEILVGKLNNSTFADGWDIFIDTDDKVYLFHADTGGEWTADTTTLTSTTAWYHVFVFYDDGNTGNNPIIVINGTTQSLTEGSAPGATGTNDGALNLYIGLDGTTATGTDFDGMFDDVTVWKGTITSSNAASIAANIYAGGRGVKRHSIALANAGVVMYQPLDEIAVGSSISGNVFNDMTSNGNNCTQNTGGTSAAGILNYPQGAFQGQ